MDPKQDNISNAKNYEATPWTQKEVLLLLQKLSHTEEHRILNLPSANWSGLDLRGISLKHAKLEICQSFQM